MKLLLQVTNPRNFPAHLHVDEFLWNLKPRGRRQKLDQYFLSQYNGLNGFDYNACIGVGLSSNV